VRNHRVETVPPHRHRAQETQRVGTSAARVVLAVLGILLVFAGSPSLAEDASKKQMQSLDEQVQEIKSDVLSIAAELGRLEERLLFPSNTQVAVFVSVAEGETLRFDSVQIQIDGELVAHHIYSFKELEALQKGGVQRIYTGNLVTGEHRIDVAIAGKKPGGGDFTGSESFTFVKEVEPKLVGITLAGQGFGDASIEIEDW
jgi:DMSO/TMAO reductase YedYZ molybdopterin-dependent catalytic subunit